MEPGVAEQVQRCYAIAKKINDWGFVKSYAFVCSIGKVVSAPKDRTNNAGEKVENHGGAPTTASLPSPSAAIATAREVTVQHSYTPGEGEKNVLAIQIGMVLTVLEETGFSMYIFEA